MLQIIKVTSTDSGANGVLIPCLTPFVAWDCLERERTVTSACPVMQSEVSSRLSRTCSNPRRQLMQKYPEAS